MEAGQAPQALMSAPYRRTARPFAEVDIEQVRADLREIRFGARLRLTQVPPLRATGGPAMPRLIDG
jgi:hypothetical protein